MGRHRLTKYELRYVSPAYAPAVGRREPPDDPNGKVIIDVDARLRGQELEDAIEEALEPFERGWLGLIPVPLLAWAHEHPRAAATAASMGTVAVLGMATLTISGGIEPPGRPHAAAIPKTALAQIDPAPSSPSPVTSGSPTPTRTVPDDTREPADTRPTPVVESNRPAAAGAPSAPSSITEAEPPVSDQKPPTEPTTSPTVERPRPTPRPSKSAPIPDLEPAPTPPPAPDADVEVEVDLGDRQVGVKVGDTVDVDLKERKVSVGDLEVDLP